MDRFFYGIGLGLKHLVFAMPGSALRHDAAGGSGAQQQPTITDAARLPLLSRRLPGENRLRFLKSVHVWHAAFRIRT